MPQTVELPDDLAGTLSDEAQRIGMSLSDYAVHLLTAARPAVASVRTGADLVAYWQSEGLIGTRPEIADGPAHARQLREQAQRRGA